MQLFVGSWLYVHAALPPINRHARRRTSIILGVIIAAFGVLPNAHGQKAPTLGYVFPPAVGIGQTTAVQLGGYDFTPDMQAFVHDQHVQLELLGPPGEYHVPPPPYWHGSRASSNASPLPREIAAQISVDERAPPGLVRWQVANANGASATAVFYRSRGREVLEARSRDFPQRLAGLPLAVSGRLERLTEVDRYEFVAQQDGLVTIQLMARQLGADFFGHLRVEDDQGQVLADFADTEGRDGAVTFVARAGQLYTVSLHDVDFRGDRAYIYRLALTRGPSVVCTVPAYGQRGTTREVEFIGWGLATGTANLESVRAAVSFPADAELAAYTHPLETSHGQVEVVIPLSDVVELDRSSISDTAGPAPTAPFAVTGRFAADADEHPYRWQAAKDELWSIKVASRAIGGCLDVALQAAGPDKTTTVESDDLPGTTDAAADLSITADGTAQCTIRSLNLRRETLDEIYRLEVVKRSPDFALSVPDQRIHVPSGGSVELTIMVQRIAGFSEPIHLSLEGLPAGVTVEGELVVAPDQAEKKLTLHAAADAAVVAGLVSIRGTATLAGGEVVRLATASAAGNLCPRTADEQQTDRLLLAMTMAPPFDLELVDAERQRQVPRGTTYLAPFIIKRNEGYKGRIWLEMAAQQARYRQGIHGPTVFVEPDQQQAEYPCFMPEWLATDITRRMVVQAVGEVPDPTGRPRCIVKQAASRITMILEGALLKISVPSTLSTARLGAELQIPVEVSRAAQFDLPVKVELQVPAEIEGLIEASPLALEAGQDRGILIVRTAAEQRLTGPWTFRVVATALQDGRWPVVSQADVLVALESE